MLRFPLPDSVRAALQWNLFPHREITQPEIPEQTPLGTVIIDRHGRRFLHALLPLWQRPLLGVSVWVQIDLMSHEALTPRTRERSSRSSAEEHLVSGVLNSLLVTSQGPHELWSDVVVRWDCPETDPLVIHRSAELAPFDCLEMPRSEAEASALLSDLERHTADLAHTSINAFETQLALGRIDDAVRTVEAYESTWRWSARAHYGCGVLALTVHDLELALTAFYHAAQLAHPFAPILQRRTLHQLTKPVRLQLPEVFPLMQRGDHRQAARLLTALSPHGGNAADALHALCLLQLGTPEEGLALTERLVLACPEQPDVLGYRWRFLFDLGRDEEALSTSLAHLRQFPFEVGALGNAIDSLLLLNRTDDAFLLLTRYRVFTSPPLFARRLFAWAEASGAWDDCRKLLQPIVERQEHPSCELLAIYGETLTECGNLEEALAVFRQAQEYNASDSRVQLGHARCLAQLDREAEAETLLLSSLTSGNSAERFDRRALLVALLLQIQRNTGRAAEAVSTFERLLGYDISAILQRAGPAPVIEYSAALSAVGRTADASRLEARLGTALS